MLRYAILSLLLDGEMSGYELARAFDSSVGYFWKAGHTQIYPELRRLEDAGLVEGREIAQTGKPDKRTYIATGEGHRALLEWIEAPTEPGPLRDPLMIKAFNFGRMPTAMALAHLAEHRQLHLERLSIYESIRDQLTGAGLDPGSELSEHSGWRLALEAGIRYEQMYAEWCAWAAEMLEESASRTGMGQGPDSRRESVLND